MNKITSILSVAVLLSGAPYAANASSDADIEALRETIQALQTRIESLEAVKPTFTTFMPNFAERFHVLHRAGEAGDWAVAGHELSEMKRMMKISTELDAEKAALMQGMLTPSFNAISEAIEQGDHKQFETALDSTINTCNACHVASNSPFIQVTLDATDAVSLRHPHAFSTSVQMAGHGHGDAAEGGHDEAEGDAEGGHDEAPEAGHDEGPDVKKHDE